ncbi:MAG: phage terminase large subunit [Mesorhizobium sp.]
MFGIRAMLPSSSLTVWAATMADRREIKYEPAGPTLRQFHRSSAFVRAVMGPFGSGKSSAMAMEIIWRAAEQAPAADGKRHSRWAVIRNTYPELQLTTVKTFKDWTAGVGKWNHNPPITYRLQAGDIDLEVIFLALDKEDDVKKLLSLELTGAWLNECRELPKSIFEAVTARVGRYPSKAMGGPTWSGVILDTNPPADDHWFYQLFEVDRPAGYELFKQPSGLAENAENLDNLPGGRGYYTRIAAGKDPDWIKVYVHGQYGRLIEGKPVFYNFRDGTHVAPGSLAAVPGLPLLIGVDFGLTPSAVIGQRLADGRWLILSELTMDGAGVERFARALTSHVALTYPDHEVGGVWGDPAGNHRSEIDERTALEVLAEKTGWRVRPAAPDNNWTLRLEVCLAVFARLIDGKPGILISPECADFRKACGGGYHYRLLRTGGGLTYAEEPAKSATDPASHLADAFQYLLLGGGEANIVMNKAARAKRKSLPGSGGGSDYNVLDPTYGRDDVPYASERRRQDYLTRIGFYEADFR